LTVTSPSSESTERIGRALGRLLLPGDAVLLRGGVGAGKSVLARGIVRGCTGDALAEVPSPTYLLDLTHPLRDGVM
jgi:tRNA threonylcarbamoyladenosine biosynthesis protein TsaE